MRFHSILQSSALLVALWTQAGAQTLTPDALQQVKAASRVRIRLTSGQQGMLYAPAIDSGDLSYTGGHLLGQSGSPAQLTPPVAVSQITRIQVPHGSHALLGGKIGAGIGCGLSLLGIALTAGDSWVSPTPEEAGGAIVAFTLIGAGAGAVIGSAIPRWKTVYSAPAGSKTR